MSWVINSSWYLVLRGGRACGDLEVASLIQEGELNSSQLLAHEGL